MANNIIDLSGKTFGRLFIPGAHVSKKTEAGKCIVLWFAHCDCGKKILVRGDYLKHGNTKSCGCFRRERMTTHGLRRTSTYSIWASMIQRCANQKSADFPDYGGRGIKVCKRWEKFENFLTDMGKRPPKRSLDRIDNNRGYFPSNCRWATARQQALNRRPKKCAKV